MPISRTGTCSDSGFTLIELLVVIFIVSLLLAVSVPSFRAVTTDGPRSEAKRVASLLRYLNDTATARKEDLYFTVNLENHSIAYKTEGGEKKEGLEHLRLVFLESKGEIRDGEVEIIFTPLGAGEFMRFYIGTLCVEFNPLSGRVRVKESE